jgi:hypothetical protein
VATVGSIAVTIDDVRAYLAERPVASADSDPTAAVAQRLDEMILQEVLVQEALRRGLDRDPAVRRGLRQLLTQALISRESGHDAGQAAVSEREIQEYYAAHRDEFDRPAQVRLADIFVAVPPNASPELRAECRKRAEAALAEALAGSGQRGGFAALISKYSDVHPMYPKGDTGFFAVAAPAAAIDGALARAARTLARVGDVLQQVVEEPAGYHVIMLTGKRDAVTESLPDVHPQLARMLLRQKTRKAEQDLLTRLREQANVTVNQDLLARLARQMATPAPSGVPGAVEAAPPAPEGSRERTALPAPQ